MAKIPDTAAEKQRVKYQLQTILGNLGMLIRDSSGKITKLEPANKTMRDIFGQKDIMRNLYKCKNGAQSLHVINCVGANVLYKMVSNRKLMTVLNQLVDAKDRMIIIERIVDKAEKKGKRIDKDLIKEHAFLKKAYKEGTKMMRKHLGIHKMDSGNYKKRYSLLKDFVKDDYDGFFGGMMGFDYEDDEEEEFDARFPVSSFNPDLRDVMGSSDDDDMEDGDDGEDSVDDERFDRIEESIDKITTILQHVLTNNQKPSVDDARRRKPTPPPVYSEGGSSAARSNEGSSREFMILAQGIKNINNSMGQVNQSVGMVIDTVRGIDSRLHTVEEGYQSLIDMITDTDDDDDPEDGELGPATRNFVDDPSTRIGVSSPGMSEEELAAELDKMTESPDDPSPEGPIADFTSDIPDEMR